MPTASAHLHKNLLVSCLLLCGLAAHTQSAKTVRDLVKKHRQCANQCLTIYPTDRIKCSEIFYFQMDSLLSVAYKSARSGLQKNKRKQLERDQVKWMRERDVYFAQQDMLFWEKHKHNQWRSDMQTITYEDKANFIKDRVVMLISYSAGSQ